MLPSRSKRERRDRDSGLVFSWRLPVGNGVNVFTAMVIVGLLAAVLSSAVRIQVSGGIRQPERRGAFIMLEDGSPEQRTLERIAQEAGPFPARSHPFQEPEVKKLLTQSLSGWMPPGTTYRPEWQEVPVSIQWARPSAPPAVVLPPLPEPESSVQPEVRQSPPLRALPLASGVTITVGNPIPAGIPSGMRFMVSYDSSGRVTRVATLKPADKPGPQPVESWLGNARIEGGNPNGGWLPVEVGP